MQTGPGRRFLKFKVLIHLCVQNIIFVKRYSEVSHAKHFLALNKQKSKSYIKFE
jgi:hypothetical protein